MQTEETGRRLQGGCPAAPCDGAARRAPVADEGGKELQSRGVDALQGAHIEGDRLRLLQPGRQLRFERFRLGYRALGGQEQRSVAYVDAARGGFRCDRLAAGAAVRRPPASRRAGRERARFLTGVCFLRVVIIWLARGSRA